MAGVNGGACETALNPVGGNVCLSMVVAWLWGVTGAVVVWSSGPFHKHVPSITYGLQFPLAEDSGPPGGHDDHIMGEFVVGVIGGPNANGLQWQYYV